MEEDREGLLQPALPLLHICCLLSLCMLAPNLSQAGSVPYLQLFRLAPQCIYFLFLHRMLGAYMFCELTERVFVGGLVRT